MTLTVWTIGYGKTMFPDLEKLLEEYDIDRLWDIRSHVSPVRVKPGYSSQDLKKNLGANYYHDKRLGGKYNGPDPDIVGSLVRHPNWREGLDELIDMAGKMRIAIMCAEDDPTDCHRGRWVQDELEKRGVKVTHIRRKQDRVTQKRIV